MTDALAVVDWRPRLHYTPQRNWINDPNGLVYVDGLYHMFYQYNPHGDVWGHMSWGHAVSRDLMHWDEWPVAIAADDVSMIFSGSVVIDERNSAGFAQPGQTALVAIYTGVERAGGRSQSQHLAYSVDQGRHWTRYAGNPVLDLGLREFRDPKVFWHAATSRWIMLVSLPDRHQLCFYASTDLRQWSHLSDFGPAGSLAGIWECPDLLQLPVEGGGSAWMLKVDVFTGHPAGGSGAQYWVGDFDGQGFTPSTAARWIDHGADFYAALSWAHLPAGQAPLWLAWMSDHHYAAQTPTSPWRGAMTLPRRLQLYRGTDGLQLRQQLVESLDACRGLPLLRWSGVLSAGGAQRLPLAGVDRRALDIVLRFADIGATEAGLQLRGADGSVVRVGIDRQRGRLFVDRGTGTQRVPAEVFARRHEVAFRHQPGTALDCRIVLDACSIEVLFGAGDVVFTELVFIPAEQRELALYAHGGACAVASCEVWPLRMPQAAAVATTIPTEAE